MLVAFISAINIIVVTDAAYLTNYHHQHHHPSPISISSAAVNFEDSDYGVTQQEASHLIHSPSAFNTQQDRNNVEFPKIRSHPTGFENPYREYTPIHEPSQE